MKAYTTLKKDTHQNKGVTFVELILVVAIITTLGILSTSFFSRFLSQNDVTITTDQLVNTIKKAQIYSMMGKRDSSWGINYSNNTITLFKGTTFGQDHTFDETFSVNPNITISGLTGDIVFSRITGAPNTTPTITISSSSTNDAKTIQINTYGIVNRTN